MNELISVIIPVYNVVNNLKDCIASIENQSYKQFEIILVDDGSTDGSEKICDELSNEYKNITVLHQKNSGASAARNHGIDIANGKYIVFCDSDDTVEPQMFQKLIDAKSDFPEHLPVCGIKKVSPQKETECLVEKEKLFPLPKKDFFLIQKAQMFNSPVNKLYEKDILNKYSIRFDTAITLGEDMLFNADYLLNSNCDFIVVNEALYNYNISVSDSVSKKYIPDILENYIAMDKKFHELIDFTNADMNVYGGRYATVLLFSVVNSIKNTMSPLNPASTSDKIKHIKKIINSFDVKDIVSKADTGAYSDIYLKMLCTGNARLIYTFRTIKK